MKVDLRQHPSKRPAEQCRSTNYRGSGSTIAGNEPFPSEYAESGRFVGWPETSPRPMQMTMAERRLPLDLKRAQESLDQVDESAIPVVFPSDQTPQV